MRMPLHALARTRAMEAPPVHDAIASGQLIRVMEEGATVEAGRRRDGGRGMTRHGTTALPTLRAANRRRNAGLGIRSSPGSPEVPLHTITIEKVGMTKVGRPEIGETGDRAPLGMVGL